MSTITFLRIPTQLLLKIKDDIARPHPFAYERVGFLLCKPAQTASSLGMFAYDYCPIPDEEYVEDSTVGAMIGGDAMRRALTLAFNHGKQDVSVFHIHEHFGSGLPWFSEIDLNESARFVPDFFNTAPKVPHGTLVMNEDNMAGQIWLNKTSVPQAINVITSVGIPHKISRGYERA